MKEKYRLFIGSDSLYHVQKRVPRPRTTPSEYLTDDQRRGWKDIETFTCDDQGYNAAKELLERLKGETK